MDLWKQEIFESDLPKSQILDWLEPDDERGFNQNQPSGYTKDSVKYRLNSQGFRGTEFAEPANFKILVSGCSHTFGVGINEEDIWCNQFAQRISGAKVYNLALGGRSPDYVVRSIYKTIDIIRPNLVMVMWPDRSRLELPDGSWCFSHDAGYPRWFAQDQAQDYYFTKNKIMLESVVRSRNIPLIDFEYYHLRPLFPTDQARDCIHEGPLWNYQVANHYWQEFQKYFDSSVELMYNLSTTLKE